MTMPIDFVAVRHGQSEGNKAKRLSEAGDHSAYTKEFLGRHTASWRLTDLGVEQALSAGIWLRHTFGDAPVVPFDRCYTSEYIRAQETAAYLGLHGARWYTDYNWSERDWGTLDKVHPDEREAQFGEHIRLRDAEPFFWRPINGESFAGLCNRLRSPLGTMHRECSDKRVIAVCHGEVLGALAVLLERIPQTEFRRRSLSHDTADRIHNCQIHWYTRRDPVTGTVTNRYHHVRRVRTENGVATWDTGWQPNVRRTYSNTDLLAHVHMTERMVA